MLSDPKFLVEDYKTEDLFDFTGHAESLKGKIESLPNKSLLGVVGSYGMGKSTLLEKTHEILTNDSVIWVHFDAWKYPERTNLWEGFVLDFVRQVAPKDFEKTIKIMDGTAGDAKKKITKLAGSVINIGVAGAGAVIGKLADFFVTSPAKRVFQIQRVLGEVLLKDEVKGKQIYVVIEDADRSGDAGVYFIETLSNFLRTTKLDNKIKVFVPIAGKSFTEKRDAYIKALDFVEFFDIHSRDFTKFVKRIFAPELTSDEAITNHLVEWLQRLVAKYGLSFRDVKFIIRNSESKYQSLQAKGYTPDPRIVLIVESTRYIKDTDRSDGGTVRDTFVQNRHIDRRSDAHLLILSIGQSTQVERMAETVNNHGPGNDNIFRNAIQFVDNHESFSGRRHPVQNGGKYELPNYYIDHV